MYFHKHISRSEFIQLKCKYTCISLLWWIKGRGYACVGWNHHLQIRKIPTMCSEGPGVREWFHKAAMDKIWCWKLKLQRWEYSTSKRGKIKNILYLYCLYQFVFMHELIYYPYFFSSHFNSQWRVPGVSDDNITWLPTKVAIPKR